MLHLEGHRTKVAGQTLKTKKEEMEMYFTSHVVLDIISEVFRFLKSVSTFTRLCCKVCLCGLFRKVGNSVVQQLQVYNRSRLLLCHLMFMNVSCSRDVTGGQGVQCHSDGGYQVPMRSGSCLLSNDEVN